MDGGSSAPAYFDVSILLAWECISSRYPSYPKRLLALSDITDVRGYQMRSPIDSHWFVELRSL